MTKTFDPTMISPSLIDPNATEAAPSTPGAKYRIVTLRDLLKIGMPRPGKPMPPHLQHRNLAARLTNYLPRIELLDLEDKIKKTWDSNVLNDRRWRPLELNFSKEITFTELKKGIQQALKDDDEDQYNRLQERQSALVERALLLLTETHNRFVTVTAPLLALDGKTTKQLRIDVRVDAFFLERPMLSPSMPVLCYLTADSYPTHLRGKTVAKEPEAAPAAPEPAVQATAAATTASTEDAMAGLVDPFALLRPKA